MHDAAWHTDRFTEFCLYEMATGGPDPHMRYIGKMSEDEPFEEKLWRIGLYVAFYNVPTAEVIWQQWSWRRVVADLTGPEPRFTDWLAETWPRLTLRKERRAARSIPKMTHSLTDYIFWTKEELLPMLRDLPPDGEAAYHTLWDQANDNIPYFGRYALLKLLEAYRRAGVKITTPDICAKGGWSPRMTLNLITGFDIDPYDNLRPTIGKVDALAADALSQLNARLGLAMPLDFFRFEVMLCEYHESYESKRQYPGRSNDSELKYAAKIAESWPGNESRMLWARQELCPYEALGEKNGWDGPREDLGPLLSGTGQTWSDILFTYPDRKPRFDNEPFGYDRIKMLAYKTLSEDLFA
jgi:hypothetical protein